MSLTKYSNNKELRILKFNNCSKEKKTLFSVPLFSILASCLYHKAKFVIE